MFQVMKEYKGRDDLDFNYINNNQNLNNNNFKDYNSLNNKNNSNFNNKRNFYQKNNQNFNTGNYGYNNYNNNQDESSDYKQDRKNLKNFDSKINIINNTKFFNSTDKFNKNFNYGILKKIYKFY